MANRLRMHLLGSRVGLGQAYFMSGRYRDAELNLGTARARFSSVPRNVPPATGPSLLVLAI